jgi:hypothetical protein
MLGLESVVERRLQKSGARLGLVGGGLAFVVRKKNLDLMFWNPRFDSMYGVLV